MDVILKDIGPCICTVQEDSFLTDWNDFFYNDTKLGVSDDIVKRAVELTSDDTKSFESVIGKLEESRIALENEKSAHYV